MAKADAKQVDLAALAERLEQRPAIAQVLVRLESYGLPWPTVGLENNGEIGLDWHERRAAMLSLNVSDDGYVGWSVLIDDWHTYGRWRIAEWPDELDKLLKRYAADCAALRQRPQEERPTGKTPRWAAENCHMLARRQLCRGPGNEAWQHVLRICEEAGVTSDRGVLREAPEERPDLIALLETSARSGLLFNDLDEPLDDYGKRIIRKVLSALRAPTAAREER